MQRLFLKQIIPLFLVALVGLTFSCKRGSQQAAKLGKVAKKLFGAEPEAMLFMNFTSIQASSLYQKALNEDQGRLKKLVKNPKVPYKKFGLNEKALSEAVVLGFAEMGVVYVAVKGTFDAPGLLNCLQKGKSMKEKVGGKTLYGLPRGGVVFAGSKNSIVAMVNAPMGRFLGKSGKPTPILGKGGALEKLQVGKSTLGRGMFSAPKKALALRLTGMENIKTPKVPMLGKLPSLKSLYVQLGMSANLGLDLELALTQEADAKMIAALYEKVVPNLKKKAPPKFKDVASSLSMKRSGSQLALSVSLPGDLLIEQAKKNVGKAFQRFTGRAKSSEAALNLTALSKGATGWYNDEHTDMNGNPTPRHFPIGKYPIADGGKMKGEAQTFVAPKAKPCANGNPKYMPNPAIWSKSPWKQLQFGIPKSHYYQYTYTTQGKGKKATAILKAQGDLDCDGKLSTFMLKMKINSITGEVETSKMQKINPTE